MPFYKDDYNNHYIFDFGRIDFTSKLNAYLYWMKKKTLDIKQFYKIEIDIPNFNLTNYVIKFNYKIDMFIIIINNISYYFVKSNDEYEMMKFVKLSYYDLEQNFYNKLDIKSNLYFNLNKYDIMNKMNIYTEREKFKLINKEAYLHIFDFIKSFQHIIKIIDSLSNNNEKLYNITLYNNIIYDYY